MTFVSIGSVADRHSHCLKKDSTHVDLLDFESDDAFSTEYATRLCGR